MLAYIPYMDPMGYWDLLVVVGIYSDLFGVFGTDSDLLGSVGNYWGPLGI